MDALPEAPCCPCCGQAVAPAVVLFERDAGTIAHGGAIVRLPPKEAAIFAALYDAAGKVVDKDRLFDEVYGTAAGWNLPEPKIIDVFICKMRKKLDAIGVVIETSWGRGFRLVVADPEAAAHLRAAAIRRRIPGAVWRPGDEERVAALKGQGLGLTQIAAVMGRPYQAVARALDRLEARP